MLEEPFITVIRGFLSVPFKQIVFQSDSFFYTINMEHVERKKDIGKKG